MSTFKIKLNENNLVIASRFDDSPLEEGWVYADMPDSFFEEPEFWVWSNGSLVKDETLANSEKVRLETIEEIGQLKQELASSDYKAIKYAEGWIDEVDYVIIKTQRQRIRERIRELEASLEG